MGLGNVNNTFYKKTKTSIEIENSPAWGEVFVVNTYQAIILQKAIFSPFSYRLGSKVAG